MQLLLEDFEQACIGRVPSVEEVDHQYVALLAVPVTSTDPLLNALGIPGQIKIDDQVAELQVEALGPCLGREEDLRFFSKRVHHRTALRGAAPVAGGQTDPCLISLLAEQSEEVFLSSL